MRDIIDATGFDGLRGHHFRLVNEYKTGYATICVVRIDNAPLPIPLTEISADIAAAESNAAIGYNFTSELVTASGATKPITFAVTLSGNPSNPGLDTHYLLFAGPHQRLAALTRPTRGFPDSVTSRTLLPRGTRRISVSLIRDEPNRLLAWGSLANPYYTAVEAFQTSSSVSARPSVHHSLSDLGQEIYTNSMGYALVSAREGLAYSQYRVEAPTVPLYAYPGTGAHYFAVPMAQYRLLARQ